MFLSLITPNLISKNITKAIIPKPKIIETPIVNPSVHPSKPVSLISS